METRLTLRPGQPGTKKLIERYGASLVCVRYRYDSEQSRRYTTVELIVDERPWTPRPRKQRDTRGAELVALRIGYNEIALRQHLLAAGAVWNPAIQCWIVSRSKSRQLKLADRIGGAVGSTRAEVQSHRPESRRATGRKANEP